MNSLVAFVAGSPRSGTTALTRMLIEHPDVFHAGPDELGTRVNDRPTFESGISYVWPTMRILRGASQHWTTESP